MYNFIKKITIVFTLLFLCLSNSSYATSNPRALGNEKRIKIVNYTPNTVFKFTGHYFYTSIIEFGIDEEIDTISMGTPTPWQIVPAGNRMFIKPIEEDATTNMTVITNKRMYFFEMHAEEAKSINDDDLNFVIKFVYPNEGNYNAVQHVGSLKGPNLAKPELYNFRYTISGSAKNIEPLQVFDDGEFTYFKFRDINAELPAIFEVDASNKEGIVNYRLADGYVVIERVAPRYTLRLGNDVICVYNELMLTNTKYNTGSSKRRNRSPK